MCRRVMVDPLPERAHRNLPVVACRELGRGYAVVRFAADPPLPARAGQFAMLRSPSWGSAPLLPRPMSLLESGREPAVLVKVVGEGTARLAAARPGEPWSWLAPLGRPWSPLPGGARPVLVAGGVGVAPLLFLARELAGAARPEAPLPLAVYGGRSAQDLPLAAELGEVAELTVATEDGSRGVAGRVTVALERLLAAERGHALQLYTCGPQPMMAAVAALAAAAGVPCEASLEAPMACGYGVCLGCAVPRSEPAGSYLYACVDGPCVDARSVDWRAGPRGARP
ncbi:MAG: dihydroorotate dehydrogenase electron transfer subunit [Polyangiaceae bacterium]|nr:dihydroorotate dehydrogenase electron transfer subunit [Polyangiaceae bacterium]